MAAAPDDVVPRCRVVFLFVRVGCRCKSSRRRRRRLPLRLGGRLRAHRGAAAEAAFQLERWQPHAEGVRAGLERRRGQRGVRVGGYGRWQFGGGCEFLREVPRRPARQHVVVVVLVAAGVVLLPPLAARQRALHQLVHRARLGGHHGRCRRRLVALRRQFFGRRFVRVLLEVVRVSVPRGGVAGAAERVAERELSIVSSVGHLELPSYPCVHNVQNWTSEKVTKYSTSSVSQIAPHAEVGTER
jgi:hypothetical protein